MGSEVKNYRAGAKWHNVPGVGVRECNAKTRACPYADYDSIDEAKSPRQRVAAKLDYAREVIKFSAIIGGASPDASGGNSRNLREASNDAREKFINFGGRPCSPVGEISVLLPGDRKIVLKRESFDPPNGSNLNVGYRYYARLFSSPTQYREEFCGMNSKDGVEAMDAKLNGFVVEALNRPRFHAGDDPIAEKAEDEIVMERYEQMMQTVNEIEVMARGADKAYSQVRVDIFRQDSSDSMSIKSSYSGSGLQPYDVRDSLKVHASTDTQLKDITLNFSEVIPGSDGAKWVIERDPDGGWYAGDSENPVKVNSPREAEDAVQKVMESYNANSSDLAQQTAFVGEIFREVEPAIQSYNKTMGHKRSFKGGANPQPTGEKKSFTDKLLGLFS